jgi:hypothetical protein
VRPGSFGRKVFGELEETEVGAALQLKAIEPSRLVYPGAEREFSELLDKIDRGEPIAI